jgi:hypothetical protein
MDPLVPVVAVRVEVGAPGFEFAQQLAELWPQVRLGGFRVGGGDHEHRLVHAGPERRRYDRSGMARVRSPAAR